MGITVTLPLAEICHWHFGFSLLTDIFERYWIYMLHFLNKRVLGKAQCVGVFRKKIKESWVTYNYSNS